MSGDVADLVQNGTHADERMDVQAWRHDLRVPDRETDIHLSRGLADMEQALENCADVTRETQIPGFVTIAVAPRNPNARAIWLAYAGDEIILQAGEHGGAGNWSAHPRTLRF